MTMFSVLMSTYGKDNPQFLDRAISSIYNDQLTKPNEIVIVQDGSMTCKLDEVLLLWKKRLKKKLVIVKLKQNHGVGFAKKIGMEKCSNDLVAIMDSDDISLPSRFKRQLDVFSSKEIDVCGSWVGEFIDNEEIITGSRITPESHDEIVQFAKSRSPVNHPSVMFKKSTVMGAGNYENLRTSEDYNLFVKLIMNNAVFYNVQEVLVNMRVGNDHLKRRRGLKNLITEIKVHLGFYDMGFLKLLEVIRNVTLVFIIRIMPVFILKYLYYFLRKK